ncbi:hypothetical protein KWH04_01000 [Xanthomonas campestris pv. trichodesmae]|uniref:Uncharacterized protein n=2 Tax=Xanthomonas citri TaxID=346 RepID=A0AB33CDP6_XANCI|nr:hypothetical protein [Xanthomonas citri]ASK91081.1 hypothetical protein XcvCFBP7111P_05810 [Xanthomonas citri pv. vignicola]MBV6779247.1 hypothetical protein [Xanthomonas campestris pv. trichodesmae]MBZ3921761.1 hypothetical protein [Xanthomonas campestris pv. trichodesmae]MBZ3926361.1 hypothetical protein [Xanthomonas citri pv. sesbaniae]
MPKIEETCTFRFDGLRGGLSVRALTLAVTIADHSVRSDIEIYAQTHWVDGLRFFDCTLDAMVDQASAERSAAISRSLAYIEARGDVFFPWRLKRHIGHPSWVHFDEKADADPVLTPRIPCVQCGAPTNCAATAFCGSCAQLSVGPLSTALAEALRELEQFRRAAARRPSGGG